MKKDEKLNVCLRVLNEAYAADPAAIHALLCNRVPCNKKLADHKTIQVEMNKVASKNSFAVGMLGVINGIVEELTGESVAVEFSEPDDNNVRRIIGFVKYSGIQ